MRLHVAIAFLAVLSATQPYATAHAADGGVEVANVAPGGVESDAVGSKLSGPQGSPARYTGDGTTLSIVLGGDLGFGGSDQPVHPEGAYRHGERHAFEKLTAGIAPLIDGDINFANLETVVSDRPGLAAWDKTFNFRTHPAGLRHLVKLGFNALSAANNHAIDYGEAGFLDTIRNLSQSEDLGLKAWHGLGLSRDDALKPAEMTVKGVRVALSAVGVGGKDFARREGTDGRPGMLSYHADFMDAVDRLAVAPADVRIFSAHYGIELQVRPGASDVRKLRDVAAREGGIDIVAGHHAHVAAGVQEVGGSVVFYGLGNLMHQGMQDMGRFNMCRDYGLMTRVHMARDGDGRMKIYAVEAIPLEDMHLVAKPMPAAEARLRVEVLNHLAKGLDDVETGARGVRFATGESGRGLYCRPGADDVPGRIGALCRGWSPPSAPEPSVARRLSAACGDDVPMARGRNPAGQRVAADQDQESVRPASRRGQRTRWQEPTWSLFQPQ